MTDKKDSLGDRMKQQYESRSQSYLPRRTYTIIRVDGKAFHSLLRHAQKPYDTSFAMSMDATAQYMVEQIQGARFAYTQSDEISVLLTDFEKPETEAWFDGNVQKMASISAAYASVAFNRDRGIANMAVFDSRVFCIPDRVEVINYFIWRQKDATRNSIAMLAQSLYSHKELLGKSSAEQQEMSFQKGRNWNDVSAGFKRGRVATRNVMDYDIPVFTQDRAYLEKLVPTPWAVDA